MTDPRTRGLVLVANPRATRHNERLLQDIARECARHGAVTSVMATGLDHTLAAARDARAAGAAAVAVAGGDGTVAAVAAVLAGSRTALLPIPTGSTNVFARGLGWPMRARDAPVLIAAALAGPRRTLTLGTIALDDGPSRPFCVNAGVGLDAATVRWIEAHPEAKHAFKQLAFAIAAAGPGLLAFLGRPRLLVEVDGTPGVTAATFVAACGRPYAYVGTRPLDLLPRAAWDGDLEWLAIARPAPLSAMHHAARALGRGGHEAGRALLGGIAEREIVVRAGRPVAVQADGEALGEALRVTLLPGPTLEVVVPARG